MPLYDPSKDKGKVVPAAVAKSNIPDASLGVPLSGADLKKILALNQAPTTVLPACPPATVSAAPCKSRKGLLFRIFKR